MPENIFPLALALRPVVHCGAASFHLVPMLALCSAASLPLRQRQLIVVAICSAGTRRGLAWGRVGSAAGRRGKGTARTFPGEVGLFREGAVRVDGVHAANGVSLASRPKSRGAVAVFCGLRYLTQFVKLEDVADGMQIRALYSGQDEVTVEVIGVIVAPLD